MEAPGDTGDCVDNVCHSIRRTSAEESASTAFAAFGIAPPRRGPSVRKFAFADRVTSASSFSSRTVTSQPEPWSWSATAEPTRPHPMTIAFTAREGTPDR